MIRECFMCGAEFESRKIGNNYTKNCGAECSNKYDKMQREIYRKENKEKIKKRTDKYRSENKEWISFRRSQIYYSKRDEILSYQKKYREENNDKIRDRKKKYRDENKEYINKKARDNPSVKVKSYLSNKLGFAPDDELVELATMRRLINRAIRKAGE